MDPLHLSIALGPLAVYLLVLGSVNCSRRPLVTSGARDLAALGVAVSGLVVVGPLELFFPEDAATQMGGAWYVWLLLVVLYALALLLIVLLSRPRLIVYNGAPDQLRAIVWQVAQTLDSRAARAGDNVLLPALGVQLQVEPFAGMRSVQLVATGGRQSVAGWRQLEAALVLALKDYRGSPSPLGPLMISLGLVLVSVVTFLIVRDPQPVAQALQELLR